MIELPTPETDALFCRNGYPIEVDSSKAMQLCEKLEQERDWITEKFKLLEGCFKRAERERDEARAVAYDLASVASHCLGWHDHESGEAAERIADTLKRWKSAQPCKK